MRHMTKLMITSTIVSLTLITGCGKHEASDSAVESHNAIAVTAIGSQSFYGPVADKLLRGMSTYVGAIATGRGYMLRGLNTALECTHGGDCIVSGPTIQRGRLIIDFGSYTVAANSSVKPIQQQLYEVVESVQDGGIGSSGFANHWICQYVEPRTEYSRNECLKSGDELRVAISFDQFSPVPSPRTYSATLTLVPGS